MVELGILIVVILVTGAGLIAGYKVRDNADFLTGGGKSSTLLATGAVVGTLIGSQSTLGTAQLAFNFGISACWFTVGTALGCLAIALLYCDKLRYSGCTTQFQIISREYGKLTEKAGAILCTTGTFISILAQVTACIGFMMTLYPSLNLFQASCVSSLLICLYIIFGGTWGLGFGGLIKVALIYITCAACFVIALMNAGGVTGIFTGAEKFLLDSNIGRVHKIFNHSDFAANYLNLTARGFHKDLGSCVSLILGLLSTQTYMQFILSARDSRSAKYSFLWGLALVPPVGVAGIFIGLYMRANYITLDELKTLVSMGLQIPDVPVLVSTIQVFPAFIVRHISPFFGGLMVGTLLVTVIGGSSGLLLGISAILVEDVLTAFKFVKSHKLFFSRAIIIFTLIIAAFIANNFTASAINDLGFLSMTLRASVVFMPLTCALWLKKRISRRFILASIILSPLIAIMGALFNFPLEPLYIGMSVSVLCCVIGFYSQRT